MNPQKWPRLVRVILRDVCVILLVVGTLLTVTIFRRPTHAQLLYRQYQVAHLQFPENAVLYHFDSDLLPADCYEHFYGDLEADEKPGDGWNEAEEIMKEDHMIPIGGTPDPPALETYDRFMRNLFSDNMQVLFAHGLKTPGGEERIVILEFGVGVGPGRPPARFEILVIKPATWGEEPRLLRDQAIWAKNLNIPSVPTLFYGGTPDPQNPAGFSLTIEQNKQKLQLAGTLEPDGRVSLRPLDLPKASTAGMANIQADVSLQRSGAMK